ASPRPVVLGSPACREPLLSGGSYCRQPLLSDSLLSTALTVGGTRRREPNLGETHSRGLPPRGTLLTGVLPSLGLTVKSPRCRLSSIYRHTTVAEREKITGI
ncbi:hypothetical protein OTU49_010248, partial [Cherax quadricarinatus]